LRYSVKIDQSRVARGDLTRLRSAARSYSRVLTGGEPPVVVASNKYVHRHLGKRGVLIGTWPGGFTTGVHGETSNVRHDDVIPDRQNAVDFVARVRTSAAFGLQSMSEVSK
jgi:hypothetical protein